MRVLHQANSVFTNLRVCTRGCTTTRFKTAQPVVRKIEVVVVEKNLMLFLFSFMFQDITVLYSFISVAKKITTN